MRAPAIVLSANQTSANVALQFTADQAHVYNQTPSAIWVRIGSPQPPTSSASADLTIPPGDIINLPVIGREFGLTFADPTSVATATGSEIIGSVGNRATIIFSRDEPSLSASSINYATLALSTLTSGVVGASGTIGPFDLSLWGGLIVNASPVNTAWDQHGYAIYEISNDNANWTAITRLPLWPGMQLVAQLPRIARYARVRWQGYGAPFDPAATFRVIARPTLTEILAITPTLAGQPTEFVWGPLVAPNFSTFYVPGDLVASIDWHVTSAAVGGGATTGVQALGSPLSPIPPTVFATLVPATTIFLNGLGVKGTFSDMWPLIQFNIQSTVGTTNGTFSFIPRILQGPPDVMGSPFDALNAASLTLPGLLRYSNVDLDTIVARLALQAGLTPTVTATACLAGVWTNTGVDMPANQRVFAIALSGNGAAGNLIQAGYGTAAAVVNTMHSGPTPSPGSISLGQPYGFNYGANTRLWAWSTAAGTVWIIAWTG